MTLELQDVPTKPDAPKLRSGASLAAPLGSALVFSAHVGANDRCFAQLMALHVPDGATVADVTHGRGNFWGCVPRGKYDVKATDLADGVDCRKLPYGNGTIDAVVLDPPYVAGFFRPRKVGEAYQDFTHRYSANFAEDGPRYHDGVLALYRDAAKEAWRVLKPNGKLVLKCQDEVHAGRQYLTHIEIVNDLAPQYHAKDMFVVVRKGGNFATRGRAKSARQHHARKNHSYFLVFEKRTMNTPNESSSGTGGAA
jgi:hypothetical protein